MAQFKTRSLAVIRRDALSTQTIACQQPTQGCGHTKTEQEKKKYRPIDIRKKTVLKVRFKRGQGGCLTERLDRRSLFQAEGPKDGEKTRANSIKLGSWDSETESI